jgi:hypothetical protein
MDLHRNEVLRDKIVDAMIGVYLGIQPGATRSHGCCAEIEQHGLAPRFRLC